MPHEITDTVPITCLQYFENYQKLIPVDTSIESNKIAESLVKYKKYRQRSTPLECTYLVQVHKMMMNLFLFLVVDKAKQRNIIKFKIN